MAKDKKKRKHKEEEDDSSEKKVEDESKDPVPQSNEEDPVNDKKKKKKKDKKHKKRKHMMDSEEAEMDESKKDTARESNTVESSSATKEKETSAKPTSTSKVPSKEVRKSRREERKRLLELVPKADEHGIAYTKQQLRFMCKRVARGLDPIETEQEKQQRLREEAQQRREDEAELAGILYQKDQDSEQEDGGDDAEMQDNAVDQQEDRDENAKVGDQKEENHTRPEHPAQEQPLKKKKKRSKAVPSDYTCQACQNEHQPRHWIYDCPSKISQPGVNQVSTKHKGLHDPDPRKVFVSGLPFEATRADVMKLFSPCGKIQFCKLLTFPDSGRCKGQAILAFDSKESAYSAMELHQTTINNQDFAESKKQDKKGNTESPKVSRKELKLSVTKVMNRAQTRKGKVGP